MINILNRFLKKTESNDVAISEKQKRHFELINFLVNKGTPTSALENIRNSINEDLISEEIGKKDILLLVKSYLKLEYYLINRDSKYINNIINLRKEVRQEFPQITYYAAFLPLYANDKNRFILLAHYLLRCIIEDFQEIEATNSIANRWLASLNLERLKTSTTNSDAQHLYINRRLREEIANFYGDVSKSNLNVAHINKIIQNTFEEFISYYPHLDIKKKLAYFLPDDYSFVDYNNKELLPPTLRTIEDHSTVSAETKDVNFQNALQYLLDSIFITNRKGKILFSNNKAQEILGKSEEELAILTIYDILPKTATELLKLDFQNLNPGSINKIVGSKIECQILNKTQDLIDVEITISNNYTDVDSYCIVLKNITHKKETLKNIEKERNDAERMANAKSTFLSNMSHEIRTPLNVILGLSAIIKNGDLKDLESMYKNLDGIDFSAKNLLSIVNDILDFSKIEAGKLTIQSIDFNLNELLQNFTDSFSIKAQEKGLKLITKIDTNVPEIVIGDQYRINQILTNLVSNAIKFTEKGNVTIQVETIDSKIEISNENNILIQFKISDTGVGISKENLDRIFSSFYQIEDELNSKISGTGLGLTITKELINLQKGVLNTQSNLNKGSVFTFTIPFKKSKLKRMQTQTSSNLDNDKKLQGLKVLVAEDNKMNQFYIKQLLNNLKITVDVAENGLEAVEKYKASAEEYNLILMDLHMPVMNGLEAIQNIRALEKNMVKKIPIVACSADVFPESRKNAIIAGIDFYLLKPLSPEALKEVLYWLISDEHIEKNTSQNSPKENDSKSMILSRLMETFDNDTSFVVSLLEVFIQETPNDYNSLCNCMDREFYARASALAHKIKSSFMNLGLIDQGHHLQQIELGLAKKSSIGEAKKHMDIFKTMYPKTLLDVNLLLIELKSKGVQRLS